jgi:antimicrobial peptide system SdpB family protein
MNHTNVFTNTYGLSRALLALGNLITLIFTFPNELFPEELFNNPQTLLLNQNWNIFYIFGFDKLFFGYVCAIIILIISILGYFPQITCFFQAWVSYSILKGCYISEGGDQITAILMLLLIPVCIFDKRKNHWGNEDFFTYKRPEYINFFCYSAIIVIRVQMSILYLDAGIEKIKVPEWIDGTATYYWFNHNLFGSPLWMRNIFGWVYKNDILTSVITLGVILLEILLSCALFMDLKSKRLMFLCSIVFHFIIFLTHGLPAFGCAMVGGLILYLLPIKKWITFSSLHLYKNWKKVHIFDLGKL